jgi:hypothetical protein
MPRFLYIFSYQTPEQMRAAGVSTAPEEACRAVFIEARTEEEALTWGREVSEEYVRRLFKENAPSWKAQGFVHSIEREPEQEYPAAVLSELPVVAVGVHPNFDEPK